MIFNFTGGGPSALGTWLPFGGTVLLFFGSMLVLWRTNKAAFKRQAIELNAKKEEGRADRASARADQLRVEVAAILAERPTTLDSQRQLFEAMFQLQMDVAAEMSPAERSRKVLDIRQLHVAHSDKLEQMVIRAQLLTTDPEIEVALTKVRNIAHNWNEPMLAAQADNDVEKFEELGSRFTTALNELETATRKLTAIESESAPALDDRGSNPRS